MDEFWKSSLRRWGQEGVEELCLDLQDNFQADVNLVLFCFYAAEKGYVVTEHGLQYLEGQLKPWRDQVVNPLRKVRQYVRPMRDEDPEFYKHLQTAELAAEKWAQRRMDHCFNQCCENMSGSVERLMQISLERYLISHLGNERDKMASLIHRLISIQAPAPHES